MYSRSFKRVVQSRVTTQLDPPPKVRLAAPASWIIMALLCLSQCNRAVALVPEMDGTPIHVTLDAHREPHWAWSASPSVPDCTRMAQTLDDLAYAARHLARFSGAES